MMLQASCTSASFSEVEQIGIQEWWRTLNAAQQAQFNRELQHPRLLNPGSSTPIDDSLYASQIYRIRNAAGASIAVM